MIETIEIHVDQEKIERQMEKNPWYRLSKLREGAEVLLTDGSQAKFIRLKQKNFEGTINGQCFNIPITMFVKVIKEAEENLTYTTLRKGELFYISNGKNAMVFKFEKIEKGKIIGINPIDNVRNRIATSMYKGKISDIQ